MNSLRSKSLWYLLVGSFFLFLYVPIIILVLFSFNKTGFPYRWTGFTLSWYQDLFSSYEVLSATWSSLLISIFAAMLSVILSALWVFYHDAKTLFLYSITFYLNLFVPEIVYAVSVLLCMSFFSISAGIIPLIIAYTVIGFGYTIPILLDRYRYCHRYLIEASTDLGATIHQTFMYVVIPFLRPALLVSFLLTFIITFDDFLLAFFCAGSSVQTLSLYIFAMIRNGVSPAINALSTLLLGLNTAILLYTALYAIRTKYWQD